MLFFGISFLLVVGFFSFLLINPPVGYKPQGFVERRSRSSVGRDSRDRIIDEDLSPGEILRTAEFWRIWLLYFIGAGAGLMVIGNVAGMAKSSLGTNAFLAVAILAVGNAAGRVVAGMMADKIGRSRTLATIFGLQALFMFGAVSIFGAKSPNAFLLVTLATVIGFNYGANLALFPTITKDLWGMKHFGLNYGILFTAWGVGGFVMSKVSQMLLATTGSFSSAFWASGVLLLTGVGVIVIVPDQKEKMRREIARKLAVGAV